MYRGVPLMDVNTIVSIPAIQLTTSITDFFVVGKMSVDLVGFVNLVSVAY